MRVAGTASTPSGSSRLAQLDGLRGIAALVVVIHHSMLATPWAGLWGRPHEATTIIEYLLVATPGAILWDGPAAVLVFFVMSGLVLALPYTRRPFAAASYYAARLVRLYVPVWVSLAWAVLTALVVGRQPGLTWWLDRHTEPVAAMTVLRDGVLLIDVSYLNSPLWSLRWEMYFSLAFPAFLLLLRARGSRAWWVFGALMAIGFVGRRFSLDALAYLPLFGVGVVLAGNLASVRRWGRRAPLAPVLGAVVGVGLLSLPARAAGLPLAGTWRLLGACLVTAAAAGASDASFLARSRVCAWLGRISFSLYLVHEPLVVTLANLGLRDPRVAPPLLIAASLVLGDLFYRAVERPTHALARRLGASLRPVG